MTNIEFGSNLDGVEATPEQQAAYWYLSDRHLQAVIEERRAYNAFKDFVYRHDGILFQVFKPSSIDRAVSSDVQPLDFDGGD